MTLARTFMKEKTMKYNLKLWSLLALLVGAQSVEAFDIDTDVKIEAGYRRDDTKWKFDVPCTPLTPPVVNDDVDCSVSSTGARAHDIINFRDQDVWELGAIATVCLEPCGYLRFKSTYG